MAELIKKHADDPPPDYVGTDDDLPEIFFADWDSEWICFMELGEPREE